MELRKVETWEIITNKGVKVSPVTEKKVKKLMVTFQDARILGINTPISEPQALRMSIAVMNNWNISEKRSEVEYD